ncbi:tyrosine-type recombinase/integrase [Salipiger bermudensis]|uniref:tyrosine-type recombinase/integrase n=1 Tax=Salipiger bermudensis TaxID=344736 RepID=UPI003511A481
MSLILPLQDWPAADQEMWRCLFTEGNPLDDRGPLVHLRETSRKRLALSYGQWLQWHLGCGEHTRNIAPADRVTRAALLQWLSTLDRLVPMSRLVLVTGVLRIVTAMDPSRDWSPERALRARLKSLAGRGTQARKIGRILSSQLLLDTGLQLVEEAKARGVSSVFRATSLRDGAMIALLSMMPMRVRALAGLTLGTSVVVDDDRIFIAIPPELSKTHIPWEGEVPPQVAPALRDYLNDARPFLAARGSGDDPSLWLGRKGCALKIDAFRPAITKQTKRLTGISVPPHFFRDAAATSLARISPEAASLIRPVLGHSGFQTAERHYIHAQTIEAGREYADLLQSLKGTSA